MLRNWTLTTGVRPPSPDDDGDTFEWPAAILCARCGQTDCAGCLTAEARLDGAGIPWEQKGRSAWQRLWRTAHESSVNGEIFFGTLPDGGVARPLYFALMCELLAIGSLTVVWLAMAFAIAPELMTTSLLGRERLTVLTAVTAAIPVLALLMVLLHMVWGAAMEVGLRLLGERANFSHVFRYALYSCGWDLLTSPFGVAAGLLSQGPLKALRASRAAMVVPRRATQAFLLNARHLPDDSARRAVWAAAIATGTLVIAGAAAVVGLTVAAVLY